MCVAGGFALAVTTDGVDVDEASNQSWTVHSVCAVVSCESACCGSCPVQPSTIRVSCVHHNPLVKFVTGYSQPHFLVFIVTWRTSPMPIQQEPECTNRTRKSTVRMILCRSKFLFVQQIFTFRSIALFCICLMCVTRTKHGPQLRR